MLVQGLCRKRVRPRISTNTRMVVLLKCELQANEEIDWMYLRNEQEHYGRDMYTRVESGLICLFDRVKSRRVHELSGTKCGLMGENALRIVDRRLYYLGVKIVYSYALQPSSIKSMISCVVIPRSMLFTSKCDSLFGSSRTTNTFPSLLRIMTSPYLAA